MEDIERINLDMSHQDTWEWVDGDDNVYTVKLAYTKLQSSPIGELSVVFDSLWKVKGIPSALHLAWCVMSNSVPTKVNLNLREFLLNNHDCALCGDKE